MADVSRDGIWMIDLGGSTTFANQQMADLLGCDLDTLMAASVFDFMDAEGIAEGLAVLERLQAGMPQQLEFRLVRADGVDVFIEVSTCPLFAADGSVSGALGVVNDTSERRRATEQLRRQREWLAMALDAGGLAAW